MADYKGLDPELMARARAESIADMARARAESIAEFVKMLKDPERNLTQRDRARIEERIYGLANPEAPAHAAGKPEYLRQKFGLPFYSMKYRATLLEHDDQVEQLWETVEQVSSQGEEAIENALTNAAHVLRAAKQFSRAMNASLKEAIEFLVSDATANYPSRPRSEARKSDDYPWRNTAYNNSSVYSDTSSSRTGSKIPFNGPLDIMRALKESAGQWLKREHPDLDEESRVAILARFYDGIALQCAMLPNLVTETRKANAKRSRVNEPRSSTNRSTEVELSKAFKALGLKPSFTGETIDMKAVKKAYEAVILKTHPDRVKNESKRPEYEAAVKAYKLIKEHFDEG